MPVTGAFVNKSRGRSGWSGDNIGGDPVFEAGNLVFEGKLLPLEPLQRQHIRYPTIMERMNGIIQIAVFLLQNSQFHAQNFFLLHFGGGIHTGIPCNMLVR